MNRIQKRKYRKIKSRQNRIKKFGGLKVGCSGYMVDLYMEHLIRLIKNA